MRLLTIGVAIIAGALTVPAVPLAMAAEQPPEEWDGLVRKSSDELDNVWVRPNARFKAYKRVRLPPVEVAFAEDWDPNRGTRSPGARVSKEDMQNIRSGLSEMFLKEFTQHLEKGGYTLSDSNDDDVLIVQAALANLYINAPQANSASVSHAFAMNAGRVSVVMQLSDSVTQQLLARVVDTQHGHDTGVLSWSTSVSNSTEARRIIGIWADELRQALDRVNR